MQSPETQKEDQELAMKLTQQFKTPLRVSFGEVEEFVQNNTNTLIGQIVTLNRQVKTASEKINKLEAEIESLKNPKKDKK